VFTSYTKKSEIPATCITDGIRITSYSPKTAVQGELTTFIINFEYQLKSVDTAIIPPGFTIKDDGSSSLVTPQHNASKGLRFVGMLVKGIPLLFANKTPFKLQLLMQYGRPLEVGLFWPTDLWRIIYF
jgi:hypothetical protein